MSTKAKQPSDGDIIVARALSSYAQLRANVASWSGLPAIPATSADKQDDDDELLTAEPETAGVGYVAPEYGSTIEKQAKASTDKLRKQMLGKRGRDKSTTLERVGGIKTPNVARKILRAPRGDGDSDEDEGRSAVGRKRRKTSNSAPEREAAVVGLSQPVPSYESSKERKRPASYLDELLAKRSRKGNKNRHKDEDKVANYDTTEALK